MSRLYFSENPGRRERHLLRKRDNPLFAESERSISGESLEEAQRLDHEELSAFITQFRKLVHEVVNLPASAESDMVLSIKERLDKSFEQSAGLADDQRETQEAIRRLLQLIMVAVRKGAAGDPVALSELAQEEQARTAHFELLQYPLVADLLAPDSPVATDELVPTLLSVPAQEFAAAVSLFDDEQLRLLHGEAEKLLAAHPTLAQDIHKRLAAFRPGGS